MSYPEYPVITDLMAVRGAIRTRSFEGVDGLRFELERNDDDAVLLSLDLTDALSLVGLIVEHVGAAVSPGHEALVGPAEVSVPSPCICAGPIGSVQCVVHGIRPVGDTGKDGDRS